MYMVVVPYCPTAVKANFLALKVESVFKVRLNEDLFYVGVVKD